MASFDVGPGGWYAVKVPSKPSEATNSMPKATLCDLHR
jgi:hypothetical protein